MPCCRRSARMPAKNLGGIPSRSAISATDRARSPARAIPTSALIPYVVLRVSTLDDASSWRDGQCSVRPRLPATVIVRDCPNIHLARARGRPGIHGARQLAFTVTGERLLGTRVREVPRGRIPGYYERLGSREQRLRERVVDDVLLGSAALALFRAARPLHAE